MPKRASNLADNSIIFFGDTGVGKSTTINSLNHEMGWVDPPPPSDAEASTNNGKYAKDDLNDDEGHTPSAKNQIILSKLSTKQKDVK